MNRRTATLPTLKPYLEARPDRTIARIIGTRAGWLTVTCHSCSTGATFSKRRRDDPEAAAARWVERHNAERHPRRAARAALDLSPNNP